MKPFAALTSCFPRVILFDADVGFLQQPDNISNELRCIEGHGDALLA